MKRSRRWVTSIGLGLAVMAAGCGLGQDDDGGGLPSSRPSNDHGEVAEDPTANWPDSATFDRLCAGDPLPLDDPASPLDQPVWVAGPDTGPDGTVACLGPALLTGNALQAVVPQVLEDRWVVFVDFTPAGNEQLEAAARYCLSGDPDPVICPSGRLAIVAGNEVVSAPTMGSAEFPNASVVINPQQGAGVDEAFAIAEKLTGPQVTFRPLIFEVAAAGGQ